MMPIRRISNSEVRTFKECHRKWWLGWVLGYQQRKVSPLGALAIGGRLHEALAAYYVPDGDRRLDPRQTLELLLARDLAVASDLWLLTADERDKWQKEVDLQRIMLAGYMEWLEATGSDQDYEILGSETYVEVPWAPNLGALWNLDLRLIGRLDVKLRNRWSGVLSFLDHKTTASINASLKDHYQMNPQMRMYRLILQLSTGEHIGAAIYSMLRKVKRSIKANPPFYGRIEIETNPSELKSFEQQLHGTVSDMLRTEDAMTLMPEKFHHTHVPPTTGTHCQRCPFQRECNMFDDGSRVWDAMNNRFKRDEPLSYYAREELRTYDGTTEDGRGTVPTYPRRVEAGEDDACVDGAPADAGPGR